MQSTDYPAVKEIESRKDELIDAVEARLKTNHE